jgi:hypothetical protein
MISSIMNPPTAGKYQDYMDSYAVVSSTSRNLSEFQKKRIIEDSGCLFQAHVEIADLNHAVQINEEGFKEHVKSDLANRIALAIKQKATYTQIKINEPLPLTRVKAKVIVMSEQELMNLIDIIRNY